MLVTPGGKKVVLIAAVARNGVIGAGGDIPWRIPEDFAHFKRTTLGHTLLMGRATYESIGRPLPGRTSIVLTGSPEWSADGVRVAASLADALAIGDELEGDVYVAGGAAVYAAALPIADEQLITEVDLAPEGDTYYPRFDGSEWRDVSRLAGTGYDIVRRVRVGSDPSAVAEREPEEERTHEHRRAQLGEQDRDQSADATQH